MQSLTVATIRVASRYTTTSSNTLRPFICHSCRQSSLPSSSTSYRTFTTTCRTLKKSSSNPKSARKTPKVPTPDIDTHIPNNAAQANRDAEIDPYDFTDLQAGIDKALARLKSALTKTRDAGRVSPENIESLPVELNIKNPDTQNQPSHKERVFVRDIASVVPKGGRTLQIYASTPDHVKPLVSAVRASQYSLAPQEAGPEDPNPLCITVPVPPVTAETRAQAAGECKKCLEKASGEIREVRGQMQKRFRRMEIEKLVIVDEIKKAHKKMEEVVRKGNEDAKKAVDGAVKALGV